MAQTGIARIEKLDLMRAEVQSVVKDIICKDATPAEAQVFYNICNAFGLNPFIGEIYWIPPIGGKPVGPCIGFHGYMKIANRDYGHEFIGLSGEQIKEGPLAGQWDPDPTFIYKDDKGFNRERRGELYSCKIYVHRKGKMPHSYEALFSRYNKPGSSFWKNCPELALSYKGKRQPLRECFPPVTSSEKAELAASFVDLPDAIDEEDLQVTVRNAQKALNEPLNSTEIPVAKGVPQSAPIPVAPAGQAKARPLADAPTNFEIVPVRIKAVAALKDVHDRFLPTQTMDYIVQRATQNALKTMDEFLACEIPEVFDAAMGYVEEYLGKTQRAAATDGKAKAAGE